MDRTDESKYHLQNDGPIYGQIIGEGNQITQHFYNPGDASTRSTLQQRVCNIPYPPNPYFTGREELLSRLEATLRAGQPAALSRLQAISGLGGIGKTQVALAYAYHHLQVLSYWRLSNDICLSDILKGLYIIKEVRYVC